MRTMETETSLMLSRRTERAGRGLRVAGERATVLVGIVWGSIGSDGEIRVVERREGVEMRLGEAVEPLYLILEDALSAMREGEVCRVEPVPREMVGDLRDLSPSVTSLSYSLSLVSFTRAKQVWEMEASEVLSLARQHKERGGRFFQEGRERAAAICYSRAAKLAAAVGRGGVHELEGALGLNLAACQLKLGQESHASSNCSRVLRVDPGNVKALYRRGVAGMRLGDLDRAEKDLQEALEIEPGNTAVQRKLREMAQLKHHQSTTLSQALRPMFSNP